jgi:exodeoxyribonuclease V beta subunit
MAARDDGRPHLTPPTRYCMFEAGGRFYLADYKSNWLGDTADAYREEALPAIMAQHSYDLQYLIYTVALPRYLRFRLPNYDYEAPFGGVLYLFFRGMDPGLGPGWGFSHTPGQRPDRSP